MDRLRRPVHVIIKPAGARCNCACDYCFYLGKAALYPGSELSMTPEVQELALRRTIEAHEGLPEIEIAWQGGEPTLLGLDFFRRAVEIEKACVRPGQRVSNTLQTNGLLLDEDWGRFLRANGFLVGLSLDGPRELHDAFRRDRAGRPTFDRAVRAARLMDRLGVPYNVLCTVHAANSRRPLDVYRFVRDELGARFLQLIPIVEPEPGRGAAAGPAVSPRSVAPAEYGRFLAAVFDEWVRRDVGAMFVTFFDSVLAAYVHGESTLCVLRRECGDVPALEHNGDLYACDHFVEPGRLLGNIARAPLAALVGSDRQRDFGRAKSALPGVCRNCRFLALCHGECPKNRILASAEGEPGLNWLCDGLRLFFAHTERPMRLMAGLLQAGRPALEIMDVLAAEEGRDRPKPGPVRRSIPRAARGTRGGRAR